MITSIFFNLILLLFPLLLYVFYIVYSEVSIKEEKKLFFDLALFTSYYMCLKFGKLNFYNMFILSFPLFLSLCLERKLSYVILSILSCVFLSNRLDIPVYLFVFKYILIYLLSFKTKMKKQNSYILLNIVFYAIIIIFLPTKKVSLDNANVMISIMLMICIMINIIVFFEKRIADIFNSYRTFHVLSKEKKFYESLFKITHEIKNPLAVCKGYLDMIDVTNQKKAMKYVSIINQEINRTLELLKDFSSISKSINIKREKIDISMLIDDIDDEMKFIATKNIKFKCQNIEDEIYVNGDYDRLKQVLINIIKNSKEAIEKEGNISLKIYPSCNNVYIVIKDDGCGFDDEERKNVGKPFYTTKKNGTGLGVCFSKEIIEKHNGSINYYSKKNKGTTVKIKLPILKAS